jgi:ABC-type transport system involved in multi-copper enzyme maturation permease subunit
MEEKMMRSRLIGTALLVLGWLLITQRVAYAGYIDPNTGGIIFAALAGAFSIVSGLVMIGAGRIRHFWAKLRRKTMAESDDMPDDLIDPTDAADPTD